MSHIRTNSPRRERQSGIALILLTLMLMSVLLPMVGLAIDVTMLYVVKAKLQGAVDGAVLAGGRSITGTVTLAAQRTRLQNIARQFLDANLPKGYWGASEPTIDSQGTVTLTDGSTYTCPTNSTCVYQDNRSAKIYLSLSARVQVPLLFIRTIMNAATHQYYRTSSVGASGQAIRRWVRMVLVLDRSSSMSGSVCTAMKSASRQFVDLFSEERDQLGLVVFGGSAIVAYPPRDPTVANGGGSGPDLSFKPPHSPSIDNFISQIACTSNTGTAEGLILAYRELQKNPLPAYLNVIVMFTDGMPNGITAVFNGTSSPSVPSVIKTPGCTYSSIDPNHPIRGWMAQGGGYADATGYGYGFYKMMQNTRGPAGYTNNAQDVSDWMAHGSEGILRNADNATNCHFNVDNNANHVGQDLRSFPIQDVYGNATNTIDYRNSKIYHKIGKSLDMTAVTNAYQVGLVSWNAVYNAAKTIRSDTSLKPVIFCIGYEAGDELDRSLMKRIVNTNTGFRTWAQDPKGQYLSSDYDPTSTRGSYFEASEAGSISAAFQQVASEVLRLSQ